jgi:hypothetical protein
MEAQVLGVCIAMIYLSAHNTRTACQTHARATTEGQQVTRLKTRLEQGLIFATFKSVTTGAQFNGICHVGVLFLVNSIGHNSNTHAENIPPYWI